MADEIKTNENIEPNKDETASVETQAPDAEAATASGPPENRNSRRRVCLVSRERDASSARTKIL